MEIRLATIDDAQAIYNIEQQSFSVPWSLESVLAELEGADNKLYMVICEDNHIVGYAGAWLVYDEGQITNIAIIFVNFVFIIPYLSFLNNLYDLKHKFVFSLPPFWFDNGTSQNLQALEEYLLLHKRLYFRHALWKANH